MSFTESFAKAVESAGIPIIDDFDHRQKLLQWSVSYAILSDLAAATDPIHANGLRRSNISGRILGLLLLDNLRTEYPIEGRSLAAYIDDSIPRFQQKVFADTGVYKGQMDFQIAEAFTNALIQSDGLSLNEIINTAIGNDEENKRANLARLLELFPDKSFSKLIQFDEGEDHAVASAHLNRLTDPLSTAWHGFLQFRELRNHPEKNPKEKPVRLMSWLIPKKSMQKFLRVMGMGEKQGIIFHIFDLDKIISGKEKYDISTSSGIDPTFGDLLSSAFNCTIMSQETIRRFILHGKLPKMGYATIPHRVFFQPGLNKT